jgi:hypothetical protein
MGDEAAEVNAGDKARVNLSDPGAEEALCDSPAPRRFAGVDFGPAPAPDETTILNFRHLLDGTIFVGPSWIELTSTWRAAISASDGKRL